MPATATPNLVSKFFYFHGLDLTDTGTQLIGDCPFCDGSAKFHADDDTGQWDCKSCGEKGNAYSFLEKLIEEAIANTDYTELATKIRSHRKKKAGWKESTLPSVDHISAVLARSNWAFHHLRQGQLVAPIFAPTKKSLEDEADQISFYVANLRLYDLTQPTPRFCSSPKIHKSDQRQHPWVNASFLLNHHPKAIWITEGEWDGMILDYALNGVQKKDNAAKHENWVLATAGGSVSLDLSSFKRVGLRAAGGAIPIVIIGDNDAPDKHGNVAGARTAKALAEALQSTYDCKVSILPWPESTPLGYDLTDALANPQSPFRSALSPEDAPGKKVRAAMQVLIEEAGSVDLTANPLAAQAAEPSALEPIPFSAVLQGFKDLKVTLTQSIREALWIAGACTLASQVPGAPPWTFLVGSPGSGKSLVLGSFASVEQTYYQTSLNKKSMVSGYNAGGGDPSLLAQLVNPSKLLVVKDWTTILDMPKVYHVELGALLREAFDGAIDQKFANGPHRKYFGQFGIIAGVTPKINKYQDSDVGARFLKRMMSEPPELTRKLIRDALTLSDGELESPENEAERRKLIRNWIEPLAIEVVGGAQHPSLTESEVDDLEALAYWGAYGRAVIERDRNDGSPLYQSVAEQPTRIAKQLKRMIDYLRFSDPTAKRSTSMQLAASIAWDTAWSRKTQTMLSLAVYPKGLSSSQLASKTHNPKTTVERTLHDLEELNVVVRSKRTDTKKIGRNEVLFQLSDWFRPYADICADYFA